MTGWNPESVLLFGILLAGVWLLGLPFAECLIPMTPDAADHPGLIRRRWLVHYAAPILGFLLLCLGTYFLSITLRVGTDPIARVVLLVTAVMAGVLAWINRSPARARVHWAGLLGFGLLMALASVHVMGPVWAGWWHMANTVGNDGARYYMMIDFLRTQPWTSGVILDDTLIYPLYNRPLQHYSGALIASIFNVSSAISYSLAAGLAATLGMSALLLATETFFVVRGFRIRILCWIIAAALFGIGGSMLNIYYSGYLAQHFSVFLVVAALAGLGFSPADWRLAAWLVLFSVGLALGYSITLTFNFGILAVLTVALRWWAESWRPRLGFALLVAGVGGMGLSLLCAVWERQHLALSAVAARRNAQFVWGWMDSILRWSGMVNRYESVAQWRPIALMAACLAPGLLLAVALARALTTSRQRLGYTIVLLFYLLSGAFLLVQHADYLANKSSLYWTPVIMIGVLGAIAGAFGAKYKLARGSGVFLTILVLSWIGASSRVAIFHRELASGRFTQLDARTDELRATAVNYLHAHHLPLNRSTTILALDDSPERGLLIRQLFHEVAWQPQRIEAMWSEYNYRDQAGGYPAWFDTYRYDLLLVTDSTRAWDTPVIDWSCNRHSLILQVGPYLLFGPSATAVEAGEGLNFTRRDWDNPSGYRFPLTVAPTSGRLTIINRNRAQTMTLSFRCYGPKIDDPAQAVHLVWIDGRPLASVWSTPIYSDRRLWTDFTVVIALTPGVQALRIVPAKSSVDAVIGRISWE
jgi:hypothetical protein